MGVSSVVEAHELILCQNFRVSRLNVKLVKNLEKDQPAPKARSPSITYLWGNLKFIVRILRAFVSFLKKSYLPGINFKLLNRYLSSPVLTSSKVCNSVATLPFVASCKNALPSRAAVAIHFPSGDQSIHWISWVYGVFRQRGSRGLEISHTDIDLKVAILDYFLVTISIWLLPPNTTFIHWK